MDRSYRPEESWILTGIHRGGIWLGKRNCHAVGLSAQVAFSWDWALDREERKGDVVGWMHTHPLWDATPSTRDVATMRAWVGSFGKPLLCAIQGIDGLSAYLFRDDEDSGLCLPIFQRFGNIIVGADYGRHAHTRNRLAWPRVARTAR